MSDNKPLTYATLVELTKKMEPYYRSNISIEEWLKGPLPEWIKDLLRKSKEKEERS